MSVVYMGIVVIVVVVVITVKTPGFPVIKITVYSAEKYLILLEHIITMP